MAETDWIQEAETRACEERAWTKQVDHSLVLWDLRVKVHNLYADELKVLVNN